MISRYSKSRINLNNSVLSNYTNRLCSHYPILINVNNIKAKCLKLSRAAKLRALKLSFAVNELLLYGIFMQIAEAPGTYNAEAFAIRLVN